MAARRAAITSVPGTVCACTKPGRRKSPAAKRPAISCMCRRICDAPAESPASRWSSMRPPSGSGSKMWVEVYWSTPIADFPRVCTAANDGSVRASARRRAAATLPPSQPASRSAPTARASQRGIERLPLEVTRALDDPPDQSVAERGLGAEPEVPVRVFLDALERLSGLAGEDPVQAVAHAQDLPRLD